MDARDWVEKGVEFTVSERYEDAVVAYEKAIEMNPRLLMAWYNKAVALDELRRDSEALDAYSRVIEISRQLRSRTRKKIRI